MRPLGQFQTFLFFFTKRFCKHRKRKKHKKHKNANKLISDPFPLRYFLSAQKRCLFCFCSLICVFVLSVCAKSFCKKKTYQLFLLALNSQKIPLGETLWLMGHHAMPEVILFFIIAMLLTGHHAMQWSSSGLPWVLRICENVFYSQAFFTLHSFLLVSRPPWGQTFNIEASRVSCLYFQNIGPARLFLWIITIQKKVYKGRSI